MSSDLLLIDDDEDLLRLMEIHLGKLGHRVTTASTWDEVVRRLNRNEGQSRSFDIIFLDLMMPMMSGFDIMQSLNDLIEPLPPIVVLTALSGVKHAIKAKEMGTTKFLTKPVSREKLAETIQEIMLDRGGRP